MYFEKNGYLVVNNKNLSFLTEDGELTDDIQLAEIFSSNQSALNAINTMMEGYKRFSVFRYNETIWLDEDAEQPASKNSELIENKE